MLSAHQASAIVLDHLADVIRMDGRPERFVGPETWHIDALFNALRRKPLHPGELAE